MPCINSLLPLDSTGHSCVTFWLWHGFVPTPTWPHTPPGAFQRQAVLPPRFVDLSRLCNVMIRFKAKSLIWLFYRRRGLQSLLCIVPDMVGNIVQNGKVECEARSPGFKCCLHHLLPTAFLDWRICEKVACLCLAPCAKQGYWCELNGIFIGVRSYFCDAPHIREITAFTLIWLIAQRSFCCFSPNSPKSNLSQISRFNKASWSEGDEWQKFITNRPCQDIFQICGEKNSKTNVYFVFMGAFYCEYTGVHSHVLNLKHAECNLVLNDHRIASRTHSGSVVHIPH